MYKLYAFLFVFLFSLWPAASGAQAAEPAPVLISEINWAGSSSSIADEWIELYNPTSEDVDLGGWILTGSASGGEAIQLADGTIIYAESTLLIANYALSSEKTTLLVEPDLVTSALSVSNSSFEILLTTPDGLVVDEATLLAGSSSPSVSQERNVETHEWFDAVESLNVSDVNQLATPGFIEMPVAIEPGTEQETTSEPEEDMQAWCVNYLAQLEEVLEEPVEDLTPEPATEPEDEPLIDEPLEEPEETIEVISFAAGDVLVNEVVSNPEDSVEWIELYNPGPIIIDLTAWTIEDRAGRDTVLEGSILPEGYAVIESPNGQLNNDGDDVVLKDPNGQVIDSMNYDENPPAKGESYVRTADGDWQTTTVLTPGAENILPEVTGAVEEEVLAGTTEVSFDEQEVSGDSEEVSEPVHRIVAVAAAPEHTKETVTSVSAASSNKSDETVTMTGTVTALPDTFGRQIAFIEGVQLYFYHADWPELALGDVVEIRGEPSSNRGEPRLKISSRDDLTIVDHAPLSAYDRTIESLTTADQGSLVTITGDLLSREGDKMTFTDNTGQILVVAHPNTGIRWTQYDGVNLAITGIVRVIEGEVRLYPRSETDIQNVVEETIFSEEETDTRVVGSTKNNTPWAGLFLVGITIAALGYWFFRDKQRRRVLNLDANLRKPAQQTA